MADEKSDPEFNTYIDNIYNVETITDEEFKTWVEAYSYKGFDRKKTLKELSTKVQDPKILQQIILITGMMGPQRASKMQLLNGKTVSSYGIPASGMKGSEGISCQRITAATADLCAYFLWKAKVPKRINVACPAWLQFPNAGSLPLSQTLRDQHYEFAKQFSTFIGGVFNEQIYFVMSQNTYCDKKILPLLNPTFDPSTSSAASPAPTSAPIAVPIVVQRQTAPPKQKQ